MNLNFERNQMILAVIVVCVTILLLGAMTFGLDLSWIPGLLTGLLGGK